MNIKVNDDGTIVEQVENILSVDDVNAKITGWKNDQAFFQNQIADYTLKIADLQAKIDAYTPVITEATGILTKLLPPLGVDQQIQPL